MSLVGSYVMMEDGNYYDLTLRGDGWFLCWDDDDPPELVIKAKEKQSPAYYRNLADLLIAGLKEQGLIVRITGHNHESGRCFSNRMDMFHHATSWWVEVDSKIPMKFLPCGARPIINEYHQGCYYTPGYTPMEIQERIAKKQTWIGQVTDYLRMTFKVKQHRCQGYLFSAIDRGLVSWFDPVINVGTKLAELNSLERKSDGSVRSTPSVSDGVHDSESRRDHGVPSLQEETRLPPSVGSGEGQRPE